MEMEFFHIPAREPAAAEEELRRFLAGKRVATVDRQFVADGPNSFWAVCVVCVSGAALSKGRSRGRIDYREVLGEKEFAVFAKLRSLRKELADKEGVPAYALFTNEQLAAMVTGRVTSAAGMAGIDGVSDGKVGKYGKAFLEVLNQEAQRPRENGADATPKQG